MTPFEDYLLQQKIRNLQPGDKLKYIGRSFWAIKPNEVCTFLEFQKLPGILYAKVKLENYKIYVHPKDIIKI